MTFLVHSISRSITACFEIKLNKIVEINSKTALVQKIKKRVNSSQGRYNRTNC